MSRLGVIRRVVVTPGVTPGAAAVRCSYLQLPGHCGAQQPARSKRVERDAPVGGCRRDELDGFGSWRSSTGRRRDSVRRARRVWRPSPREAFGAGVARCGRRRIRRCDSGAARHVRSPLTGRVVCDRPFDARNAGGTRFRRRTAGRTIRAASTQEGHRFGRRALDRDHRPPRVGPGRAFRVLQLRRKGPARTGRNATVLARQDGDEHLERVRKATLHQDQPHWGRSTRGPTP
jgi:hypothetical protein